MTPPPSPIMVSPSEAGINSLFLSKANATTKTGHFVWLLFYYKTSFPLSFSQEPVYMKPRLSI